MIFRLLIFLLAAMAVRAQVDDLVDDPWNVPQWDALQVYRDAPLCLHCAKPTELTVLPGIGRATAARIRRAVDAGVADHDALADTACLSVDQRIVLMSTTTFTCSCGTWFQSARTRLRSVTSPAAAPDLQSRVDITTHSGRFGGLVRSGPQGEVVGGWASLNAGPAVIHVGDLALRSGLGLVHGGGGGFGRGPLSRIRAAGSGIRMRPWTSTWQEFGQRGVGVHLHDTVAGAPYQTASYWSARTVADRSETTLALAAEAEIGTGTSVGFHLQHLEYDAAEDSRSMTVVPQQRRTLASLSAEHVAEDWRWNTEVAIDDSARIAAGVVAEAEFGAGRVVSAVRWTHPDLRNPYAAPISSASSLGNEAGVLVGMQWRRNGWAVEGSLDLHQRLSRSYGSPLPSRGFDLLIDGERRLSRMASVAFRGRYESDADGWRREGGSRTLMVRRDRSTLRGELQFSPRRDLRVRLRGDVRHVAWDRLATTEIGSLLYIDVRWTPTEAVTLMGRHTRFSSPGIDAAPYTLESPLTGLLRTVAGSGSGSRQFLSVRYTPLPWITCSGAVIHEQRNGVTLTSGALQIDVRVP